MFLRVISISLFFISFITAYAQVINFADDSSVVSTQQVPAGSGEQLNLYFRNDISGGVLMHSNGYGGYFRRGYHLTGIKRLLWEIEIVTMKHPKEYKSYNPVLDDNKGFIFGKLNSLTIVRPLIGWTKTLFRKETKRGVQINYVFLGGPLFGIVKPIYLQIMKPTVNNPRPSSPSIERYDPEQHTIDKIYGKAPELKGLEESVVYTGLHTKFAFNFEYAPLAELIRAVEAGVTLDAFYKPVPMMAFVDNKQFFLTFYASFQFGKKYN